MFNKGCQYCGNNPTPHFLAWYFESTSCFLQNFRSLISRSGVFKFFIKIIEGLKLEEFLIEFCLSLKVIKLNSDINLCKISRAKVLWQEAGNRGIKMQEIILWGKSLDCYRAEKLGKIIYFSGLPRPSAVPSLNFEIMDDKAELKKIFLKNNLPVPLGGSCRNFKQALKIFKNINKPVIIKPRLGSRGRHSTTFVKTEEDLKKAFAIAKQLCYWVVVEEQLFGPVYRATLIDFKLAGVLKGEAPFVVGNGVKNIVQLIDEKNKHKMSEVKYITMTDELKQFLARQNLSVEYIPKTNETLYLLSRIGINYGGSSSEDYEICHPDNKALFLEASKVLGEPIVGFDFIIPNITISYKEQKCGFIEANSLPFINLHHEPLLGKPRNVAKMVWEMVGM